MGNKRWCHLWHTFRHTICHTRFKCSQSILYRISLGRSSKPTTGVVLMLPWKKLVIWLFLLEVCKWKTAPRAKGKKRSWNWKREGERREWLAKTNKTWNNKNVIKWPYQKPDQINWVLAGRTLAKPHKLMHTIKSVRESREQRERESTEREREQRERAEKQRKLVGTTSCYSPWTY